MMRVLLILVLCTSLFLRVYQTQDLLGFWFDQGRDAKVVWDLIHSHKFFLIGPTTGIEGIFLGPFYYYLIAPFYWLGQGDPVYPAIALALMCVGGIWFIYKIGQAFFSPRVGLIAALFYGFSASLASYNRWLSNPTPLVLFAPLLLYLVLQATRRPVHLLVWALMGLVLGLCLQFEAASASFFLPALIIIFFATRRSSQLNLSRLIFFVTGLGLTLLPQLIFDIRHDHLLLSAFKKFLITDSSFSSPNHPYLLARLTNFFDYFWSKFFPHQLLQLTFSLLLVYLASRVWRTLTTKPFILVTFWWVFPMFALLFYQGNHGYVWDYYFTGSYPAFMVTVGAIISAALSKNWLTKTFGAVFLLLFLLVNLHSFKSLFKSGPTYITLSHILTAVDWVYSDAKPPFNVDVYVPPVISHAYDYVFLWRGHTKYHRLPHPEITPQLYTLAEPDHDHPQRRNLWLLRQDGFSAVDFEHKLGPITVQRRIRTQ